MSAPPTPIGYLPGDAWLVAGATTVVLLAGPAQDTALAVWPAVRDGAPLREVIGTVAAAGRSAWAVVGTEAGGPSPVARVLVAGDLAVTVQQAAGDRTVVTGRGLLTWSERVIDGVVGVEIVGAAGNGSARDDDVLLPVPGGVVRAGFVRWTLGPAPGPASTSAPSPAPATPAAAAAEPAPEVPPIPSTGREPAPASATSQDGDSDPVADPVVPPAVEPAPPADAAAGLGEDEPADPDEQADPAESGDGPAGGPDDDAVTVISMVPRQTGPAGPAAPSGAGRRARRADVTQSVPFDDDADLPRPEQPVPEQPIAEQPMPEPEPLPAAPSVVLGDHDGITTLVEDLPEGFVPPPMPTEPPPGWVYASKCPGGHPNQPHAGNCRICGRPIPPGEPVATPRPLLGRIRLSTGVVADLDRRVVIGRAPAVSRVSSSELPRLITVPSPQHDVSRSHVEIRVDDWHLVVTDLHSTNGTVVRAPDRPEQLLHPGQELVVEPGWSVDLGDGITFVIETAG